MPLSGTQIRTLQGISTATITTVLLKRGLRNVWMRGPRRLQPDQPRIAGSAFTLRFVPAREDLATPASWSSPTSTRAAIEAIRARGLDTRVLKVPTDVADAAACRRLVDATVAAFGRIDALVNSAYVPGLFQPMESADLDDWRKTFDVNLYGTMQLTQAVIPVMKRQGGGAIVMIPLSNVTVDCTLVKVSSS